MGVWQSKVFDTEEMETTNTIMITIDLHVITFISIILIYLKNNKLLTSLPSNAKYNSFLKEIGDIAAIPKNKPLVASGTKDLRYDNYSDRWDKHRGIVEDNWA
jgi:hypothetical protein